jgi:CRISPR/Cas system-associated exonuclease Cas4 (RecB family)
VTDSYSTSVTQATLKPLQHISSSQFSSLKKCQLRAVWASNRVPNLLPISPSSRLGITVHRIIELSKGQYVDEEAFQKLWEHCIHEQEEQMSKCWFERHLVPLSNTALDFHLKRSQCLLLLQDRDLLLQARKSVTQSEKPDASKSFHEQWLQSKDGLVVGIADEIRFETEGATIIDYKTGNISGQSIETKVLSEYKEQLKLYAALFHEEHGQWPNNLIVISIDGKSHYIDYKENECLTLLEESKNMLRRVNSIIKANEKAPLKLASPSQTNCRYCFYRPICEPYFLARQGDLTEGWPNDAWGIVAEKKILRNGLGKIVLTPLSGTSPISIRGLRLERHAALDAFKKIGVFSLYSDNSDNNYKEGQFTTIYGIE